MARIGIIGGGISGLTLAFLLNNNGFDVHLFEASDVPGGAIKTKRDNNGWVAEWGPNTIIESSGRIKKLISLLNLEHRRRYPDGLAKKRYVVRDGQTVAVPVSLSDLVRTPLLSNSAKWNILREPFRPKKKDSADETLADFVRRRLDEEFLTWPIDALVGGIYAGNPERLSLNHAFPRLALLEKQHGSLILGQIKGGVKYPPGSDEIPRNKAEIFSFDDGLQVLPETLHNHLGDSVSTSCRVSSVLKTDDISSTDASNDTSGRWTLAFDAPDKQPESFDIVVYAGTSYGLKNIRFPDDIDTLLQPVSDIPHPPVASITLGFRRADISHPLDGFGMLVPGVEGFPILGTLFTSSLFPNRAPDPGHVTLTTYLGGMRQPEIAEKDEDTQVDLVIKALGKLIGLTGNPLFQHRILWSKAIPQYHIGHEKYIEQMNRVEQQQSGFYLAGNYRTGISVGDNINAAFDLADRITNT